MKVSIWHGYGMKPFWYPTLVQTEIVTGWTGIQFCKCIHIIPRIKCSDFIDPVFYSCTIITVDICGLGWDSQQRLDVLPGNLKPYKFSSGL